MIGANAPVPAHGRPHALRREANVNQRKDVENFTRALQLESDAADRGKALSRRKGAEVHPSRDDGIPVEPTPRPQLVGEAQPAALPVLPLARVADKAEIPEHGANTPEGNTRPSGRWPPVTAGRHADRQDDGEGIGKVAGNHKAVTTISQPLPPVVMEPGASVLSEIDSHALDRAVMRTDVGALSLSTPPTAEVDAMAHAVSAGVDIAVPFMQQVDTASMTATVRPDAEPASPARQILDLLVADLGAPHAAAPVRTLRAMLKPDHLGEVEIIVRSDASGGLRIRIETQLPETAERLSQDRGQIGAMLEALGIPLADGGVAITVRAGSEALPADPRLHGEGAQDSLMNPHRQSARDGNDPQADSLRSIAVTSRRTEVTTDEADSPSAHSHARHRPGRFV